jgi:hypothetical protein
VFILKFGATHNTKKDKIWGLVVVVVMAESKKNQKRQIVCFLDFKNPNIKIYYCTADIFPNF